MVSIIKKVSLTSWILIGLIGGVVVGLILHGILPESLRSAAITLLEGQVKAGTALQAEIEALKRTASDHWVNFYLVEGFFKMGADFCASSGVLSGPKCRKLPPTYSHTKIMCF